MARGILAHRPALLAGFLFVVVALLPVRGPLGAAEAPFDEARFQAQLASGEFAPALAEAKALLDPSQRDELLARVALAQIQADGPRAGLTTLSQIRDDRTRAAALQPAAETSRPAGAAGGAQADFDSLIDLITTTVRPTTWDEVGGPGTISEFRNGVYVDAQGLLRRAVRQQPAADLAATRAAAQTRAGNGDWRRPSPLRMVSLTQLEKYVQLGLAAGIAPSSEMLHLAGLERIRFVFVYPETGDLVVAGSAGPWRMDDEGRPVSQQSGRPVLQLDDLVVLLRAFQANPAATFGCSIEPTAAGLARTRQFAAQSQDTPLKPQQRGAWLKKLREQMGRQDIVVDGVDPRTRVARVLVEADYRMKLVGMGLETGTVDVPGYLSLLRVAPGEAPPALDVLRWWFTLKYDAVQTTPDRNSFELRGQAVQVLSENELLTELGKRVHTGNSDPTNAEFARRFTEHFAELAEKYPVYADLQNICDLALVASLVQAERLADRVNWHLTCFGNEGSYRVGLGAAPRSVETVINHRIVNRRHVVVGVSGGVQVTPHLLTRREAIQPARSGALAARHQQAAKESLPLGSWWWD